MCTCVQKTRVHGDRPLEKSVSQKIHIPHFHTVFYARLWNNMQTYSEESPSLGHLCEASGPP